MSLRTRIAAVASLAVAAAVMAAAVSVYVGVRSDLRGEVDNALRLRVRPFAPSDSSRPLAPRPPGPGPPPSRVAPDGRGPGPRDFRGGPFTPFGGGPRAPFGGAEGYLQLVRPDGTVERPPDARAPLPVNPPALAVARRGQGRLLTDMHVAGTHLRVLTVGTIPGGAVQVARPLDEVDRELSRVLVILVIVGLAGIVLAAVLGAIVARAALAPIGRFTRRTETLTATPDLSQRMEVVGQDELARLARSFNAALEALERSVEAQRHLVADASHELRTPIASLRANIQVLEDADRLPEPDRASLRADIIDELDELTALVGDVVELARGAKQGAALDDVRLDQIVDALVERARRRAGDGLRFDVRVQPTVVRGEPDRISRAVSNLLDNARAWSPPGGVVEVRLLDGTLTVRDHGPGFDPQDLPHVFERFFRAQKARAMPGSGLGLAIVRQAAEARGGWVEAANAAGGGAVLRVRFGGRVDVPETGLDLAHLRAKGPASAA